MVLIPLSEQLYNDLVLLEKGTTSYDLKKADYLAQLEKETPNMERVI